MNDTMNDSNDSRRITLVTCGGSRPARNWEYSRQSSSRAVFVDKFSVFRWAISSRVGQDHLDLERVVIDHAGSPNDYLEILATLSPDFRGDALFIGEGDSGYLSAVGRGGDRVLYAMSAADLRFYLDAHGLTTDRRAAA